MGAGRWLKGYNANIQISAVEPDGGFHGIEGLRHRDSHRARYL